MCRYCEHEHFLVDVDEWGGRLTACIEKKPEGYVLIASYRCEDAVYDADGLSELIKYCPMCGRKLNEGVK